MTSVERLLEYSDDKVVPMERRGGIEPENWPTKGEVTFDGVTVRYRPELPPVLDGVSFHVEGGCKCGIVGRTGAGKSTVLLALFQMTPSYVGVIRIDNVDISLVSLRKLRDALAIVPQEPVIFPQFSIRDNIDPRRERSDDEVERIMGAVQLSHLFRPADTTPTGDALSLGEKQLMAVGRALLKVEGGAKILVEDEATASVDTRTDETLNGILRRNLHNCTVLRIAHRLNSVIDCDRIVVLQRGRVMEYDRPSALVVRAQSQFRSLIHATGDHTSQRLLSRIAQNKNSERERSELREDWEYFGAIESDFEIASTAL